MTVKFTEDDLRVIRAMRKARFDAHIEAYKTEGVCTDFIESACLYASLRAYFDNVQVEERPMAASSAKAFTPAARDA